MRTIFEVAERIQSANGAETAILLLAKATLVLLIARLLLAALPRASAATKHVIATAALVAVAGMPVVSMVVPAWELPVAGSGFRGPDRETAPSTRNPQHQIGVRDDADTVPVTKSLAKALVPSQMQKATAVARASWKGIVLLGVAAVSLLMLGHMLIGMLGVWYVARTARPVEDDDALIALDEARDQLALGRDIHLLLSPRVSVPVVWGLFRPVLLLPMDAAEWSPERLRVVLLHELAHLKRVDGVSLILTRIAVSLFWFHPVAWSLERAGRNACERACDDLVLAGGTKPSAYADHLLAIARTMPAFDPFRAVTLAMSRKSQLEGRLLSILQPGGARRAFSGRVVLVACAVAVAIIVPVSALRLIAQPSKAKPQTVQAQVVDEPKSGSAITVKPQLDELEDYLAEKIEKFHDKHRSTYERALELYQHEQYAAAGDEFVRSHEEEPNDTALYNAACSYALAGDATRASKTLADAIEAGWDDFDHIADDSDFDPIRANPQFVAVVSRYGREVATRRVDEATTRLAELRRRDGDADDWYEAGLDLLRLRKLDDSIEAFQKAIAQGEKNGPSMYNIACAYALRGDTAQALAALDRAIENGYGDEDKLREDPDIASLRNRPEFGPLLQKAKDLDMQTSNHWLPTSWRSAAEHHREMTARYPNSGRVWFNYGYTSLQARDFNAAISAFRRTLEMKYRPGTSAYNIACAYALQDNRDAAFEWLARAESEGFDLGDYLHGDDDLDSLHGDPRWQALRARLRHKD